MNVNSTTDTTHSNDDDSHRAELWKDMTDKVLSRPNIGVLDAWIEESLSVLETDFSQFTSVRSLQTDRRKWRGTSDKH